MRRLTNRLLIVLALALLALGAAAQLALIHTPVPPLAFGAAGIILALLLVLARLPLVARRPIVFVVTLALLAALTGGFQRSFWVLGAIAALAIPAIFALIRSKELTDASAETNARPALATAA